MTEPGPARRAALAARRALTLSCPRCGGTRIFPGARWPDRWFRMAPECALCGLRFERAQGYFVGAIYVNYAVTTLIAVAGFFLLRAWRAPSTAAQLALWVPFVLVFPLWFFRYSRSLWLALEYFFNPEP
jgi:uncharacterized protein (DUF983 family)